MSEGTLNKDVLRTVEAAALLVDSELLIGADEAIALHPINTNNTLSHQQHCEY
jgi:hypothetical protein